MIRKLTLFLLLTVALLLVGCDGDNECANCPETGAIIYVTTHQVNLGAGEANGVFSIINKGEKALSWSISTSDAPWLSLSTTSGTNDAIITITADRSQLASIGVFRATLTISSNAINAENETVEVFILNGGQWLATDTDEVDSCWAVDQFDYYWVKGFRLPPGVTSAFVDSVSFNFCEADTVIQLLAFSAVWNTDLELWFPENLIFASEALYQVPSGWSTIPVKLFIAESPFYVGYAQLGATGPKPGIDYEVDVDTIGARRARDFDENPQAPNLFWEQNTDFETLLIRAFISPIIEYNPKLVPGSSRYYENLLAHQLAERGARPVSLLPRIR